MTRYVALLRAVNVGGTGKLPMTALKAICTGLGYARVETYIASGNVVFDSEAPASRVKDELESQLHDYAGKRVGVVIRTAKEMKSVLAANPFRTSEPSRTAVIFLDEPPARDTLERSTGRADEDIALGAREIYLHYPGGMGRSKLKIPAAKDGTARNLNTVAKLAAMAAKS